MNDSQKIKELVWSGEQANLELAQQLNQSLQLGLDDFFAQLEQCRREFNQLAKRNFDLAEFIQTMQEADNEIFFHQQGHFSDAWLAWADKLPILAFNSCPWVEIPDFLRHFQLLTTLQLKNSNLQQIPDFVFAYPALSKLNLYNNDIQQLPDGVAQAQKLQNLTLVSRYNLQISPHLSQLPNLQRLHLGAINSLQARAIPAPIFDCLGLQSLHLQGQCFQHIPPAIQQLQQLTHLELSFCPIKELSALRGLPNLRRLSLYYLDYLQQPIDELLSLPNLRQLRLIGNNYQTILASERLGELGFLERLEFVHFGNFRAGGRQYQAGKDLLHFLQTQLPNTVIEL